MADERPHEKLCPGDTCVKNSTVGIKEIPYKGEYISDYAALQRFRELIRLSKTLCDSDRSSSEGSSEAQTPAEPDMEFLFNNNTFAEDLTKRANCT
jgi:hypothetical protein